jgi:hypothetical protein
MVLVLVLILELVLVKLQVQMWWKYQLGLDYLLESLEEL